MASYSEEATIRLLWKPASDSTSGLIENCIMKAYNIINSTLVNKYSVPFTTIPSLIVSLSNDLAIYYLKLALNPGAGDIEDNTILAYKEVQDNLKKISEGIISLLDDDGNLIATKEVMSSNTEDYGEGIFNLDSIENANLNSDRLDAIEDGRS